MKGRMAMTEWIGTVVLAIVIVVVVLVAYGVAQADYKPPPCHDGEKNFLSWHGDWTLCAKPDGSVIYREAVGND
jgi:hypothetical protein